MSIVTLDEGLIQGTSVESILDSAMDAGGGLLRLTPTWVPRSFLHPGRRIKLHPGDYYRFGADRGGIDERWFGSTTGPTHTTICRPAAAESKRRLVARAPS
jgi:hypothetical protein